MRYIRMYKGSEDGAPGVTLYEIDTDGWVHRQLQVHAAVGLHQDIASLAPVNRSRFLGRNGEVEIKPAHIIPVIVQFFTRGDRVENHRPDRRHELGE